MAEAGYADGFTLELPTMTGQNFETLMPYVTQQLALINIKVKQVPLSGANAIPDLLSGKYPVVLWQLGNLGNSALQIYIEATPDGWWNLQHVPNEYVDSRYKQILTADPATSKKLQQEINQYHGRPGLVRADGLHGHQLRLRRRQGLHPDPVGPGGVDAQAARLQVVHAQPALSKDNAVWRLQVMLLLKSVGRSLAVFLVVTFAAFCLMFRNGPGIARTTLGFGATPEAVQAQMAKLGPRPAAAGPVLGLATSAVTGDLGRSFYTSESVSAALSNRVPVTWRSSSSRCS